MLLNPALVDIESVSVVKFKSLDEQKQPKRERIAVLRRNAEVYPEPTVQEWAENMDFVAEIYRKKWGVEIRETLQRAHDGEMIRQPDERPVGRALGIPP